MTRPRVSSRLHPPAVEGPASSRLLVVLAPASIRPRTLAIVRAPAVVLELAGRAARSAVTWARSVFESWSLIGRPPLAAVGARGPPDRRTG